MRKEREIRSSSTGYLTMINTRHPLAVEFGNFEKITNFLTNLSGVRHTICQNFEIPLKYLHNILKEFGFFTENGFLATNCGP